MGKKYSAEETQLIVELAKQEKSVKEIIEAVKTKFGNDRSELAIKGHVKAFAMMPKAVKQPKQPAAVV